MNDKVSVIEDQFKSGNYSRVIELIQSNQEYENLYELPLIIALYKEDSKLAKQKLKDFISQNGIGALDKIISTTSLGFHVTPRLLKLSKELSSSYPSFVNYFSIVGLSALLGVGLPVLIRTQIFKLFGNRALHAGANNAGALSAAMAAKTLLKGKDKWEKELVGLIKKDQSQLGLSKCYEFLAEYKGKTESPPAKLYYYMALFHNKLGDDDSALICQKKYQKQQLHEDPEANKKLERAMELMEDACRSINIQNLFTEEDFFKIFNTTERKSHIEQVSTKSIEHYNSLHFKFPRHFSPKDRLPVILENDYDKIVIKLSQTPLSLLLFLALERKAGELNWLESASHRKDELNTVFNKLDLIDREEISNQNQSNWAPWVDDEYNSNRKTMVGRINKEVRSHIDDNIIIPVRSNLVGIYSLVPAIQEIVI